jgi:hypothetical protein
MRCWKRKWLGTSKKDAYEVGTSQEDVNRPLTRTVFPGGWHFARGRSLAPHTDRKLQGSALGKRMVIGSLTRTIPPGGRYLARGRWSVPHTDRTSRGSSSSSWAHGKRTLVSPWQGPHTLQLGSGRFLTGRWSAPDTDRTSWGSAGRKESPDQQPLTRTVSPGVATSQETLIGPLTDFVPSFFSNGLPVSCPSLPPLLMVLLRLLARLLLHQRASFCSFQIQESGSSR